MMEDVLPTVFSARGSSSRSTLNVRQLGAIDLVEAASAQPVYRPADPS
jgi:hypothetical protein